LFDMVVQASTDAHQVTGTRVRPLNVSDLPTVRAGTEPVKPDVAQRIAS